MLNIQSTDTSDAHINIDNLPLQNLVSKLTTISATTVVFCWGGLGLLAVWSCSKSFWIAFSRIKPPGRSPEKAAAELLQTGKGYVRAARLALIAPQSFRRSTRPRPAQQWDAQRNVSILPMACVGPWKDGATVSYQRRGERLVASTYSPHMLTSPPITSFFCSSVPGDTTCETLSCHCVMHPRPITTIHQQEVSGKIKPFCV